VSTGHKGTIKLH